MYLSLNGFEWDPEDKIKGNVQHISKHSVYPDEVEEIFEYPEEVLLRRTRQGYRLAYGRTAAGRYLLIVFLIKPGHVARVITARDMTKEERHLYRTHIYL